MKNFPLEREVFHLSSNRQRSLIFGYSVGSSAQWPYNTRMDYTSFAPGKTAKQNLNTPELPSGPKHFTPKFIGLIVLLLLIGVAAYAGVWYWQSQQADQETVVATFTPRPSPTQAVYYDTQYGFEIDLPQSWVGYSTLNSQWEGRDVATGKVTQTGPLITLRHPQWTSSAPREDMPVMVFTLAQWQLITSQKLSVGAAPIAPSLLGQNSKYILALPARYNYDFKTGWEEVDQLVRMLMAFEPSASTQATPGVEGIHCGGNIRNAPTCPTGYTCQLYISEPDAGGVCVKN